MDQSSRKMRFVILSNGVTVKANNIESWSQKSWPCNDWRLVRDNLQLHACSIFNYTVVSNAIGWTRHFIQQTKFGPDSQPFRWSHRQNTNNIESWSQRSWPRPQRLEIGSWQFAASRLLNFQLYCSLKRVWLNTTFYTTEKVRSDSQRDELRRLQTYKTV